MSPFFPTASFSVFRFQVSGFTCGACRPPDRADYLARTLINRMRSLEAVLAEDQGGHDARRRIELVEKVLSVEAGVLDGALHRTTLAAMPTLSPDKAVSDRELREFSTFLRERLPAET